MKIYFKIKTKKKNKMYPNKMNHLLFLLILKNPWNRKLKFNLLRIKIWKLKRKLKL